MPVAESSLRPPKVSVVMAAYNREKEIAAAIDSVLSQDFQDFELIVVDDGSRDRTGEIVRGYGDRLRYIHQENRGVGAARNAGVRAARGEYLAYCDADDVQYHFRLGAQAHLLDQSPRAGMVFTDFKEWVRGEKVANDSLLRVRWLGPTARRFEDDIAANFQDIRTVAERNVPLPKEYLSRKVYEGHIDGWLCAVHAAWGCVQMSRTDAIRAVGGHWEAIRAYEDYVLSAEISKRYPMIYLDVPTCLYRVHPEQLTGRQRLNGECFRDSLLHTWKSDLVFYKKHRETIDMALGTAYAVMGEVEARDGNWAAAEESFRRAILEWPQVGRRPYVNLILTAIKHRVPIARSGPLAKLLPGFVPMAANTGVAIED
jgi:glycosyltransferase involved in cell wall biosynthesis